MRLFEGTPFDRPPRCERCGQLESECTCPPAVAPRTPPEKQTARVRIEKRKRGKLVTVVSGLLAEGDHLPELLTAIKSSLGAGGTLDGETLEIQGDHRDRAAAWLRGRGYRVREG